MRLSFNARVSSMGDRKFVWIPKQYHDKIIDVMDKQIKITITNPKGRIKFVAYISKKGPNRALEVPFLMRSIVSKLNVGESQIIITDEL